MDLVALVHEGFVSHIKGEGLDSWLWEATEGSGRDTLARSFKRQMLGNIGGVNVVTRETKAEWV